MVPQPHLLVVGEQRPVHHLGRDRDARQQLKAEPRTAKVAVRAERLHQEHRLDAHAVRPLFVEARLVAHGHALHEGDWHLGAARRRREAVRPLVHVEECPDAVPGAVQVVEAVLEQRLPREHIELCARRPHREARTGQLDVPLQDPRVGAALCKRRLAKVYRARRVDRAVVVLRPAVVQVRRRSIDHARVHRGRLVVRQRGVGARGADRVVRLGDVQRVLAADLGKVVGGLALVDALAALHGLLEPRGPPRPSRAVTQVRLAHALLLRGVLARLGHRHGAVGRQDRRAPAPDGVDERRRRALVQEARQVRRGEPRPHRVVGVQRHADRVEVRPHLAHQPLVYKQMRRVVGHNDVRGEHGVARHRRAAHVEHPRNLVERRQDIGPAALLREPCAHGRELVGGRHARILERVLVRGREHRRGALLPHGVHEVALDVAQRTVRLGERRRELVGGCVGEEAGVNAHAAAARQRMREPCWPVAHARLADLVQRPVGVELLGCLDVVAPVGKEVRRVAQDDGGACAAGETRDVRATRIARRRVLGRMCVFGRDDVGVDLCVAHLGTQRGEARGRVGRLRTRLGRPGGKQRALLVHGAAGRGVRARGEATHGLIGGTPRGAHLHFYEDSRHGA